MPLVRKIDCCESFYKNSIGNYKHTKEKKQIKFSDTAENTIRNANFSIIDKLIFRFLDKINPFLNKHSKISRRVVSISENIIKHTPHRQNNNVL